MKQGLILFAVIVVVFLIGRFSAPKPEQDNRRAIDRLVNDSRKRQKHEAVLKDSIQHLTILSNTWFKAYQDKEKEKVITRTIYVHDTTRNDRLKGTQLDSTLNARYGTNH